MARINASMKNLSRKENDAVVWKCRGEPWKIKMNYDVKDWKNYALEIKKP